MATAFISIGANLGKRVQTCEQALVRLDAHPALRLVRRSSLYETEPRGDLDQPPFVNLAAELNTSLEPEDLLRLLEDTEVDLGRRPTRRWGPRVIDLDLLLYDQLILQTQTLVIPHPRMHERRFVLVPLEEIAPELRDPRTGRTFSEILSEMSETGGWVRRLDASVNSA